MKDKKRIAAISALVVGVIASVAGVVFLIISLNKDNGATDGDFLVEVGSWSMKGEPGVVWNFTEIGKGKLTTNNHLNDYDFIWALEDDRLKIETNWLYDLEDEYEYTIDRGAKTLTITDNEGTYLFVAEESQGK